MVKKVTDKTIDAEFTDASGNKVIESIPYGLLVWATGNALRPLVKDLINQIPEQKDSRRGLAVNEFLQVKGTRDVWAVGDCAVANYAPTAQVASQEGSYLAKMFNHVARSATIEQELAGLSDAQGKAQNGPDRDKILDQIRELQRRLVRVKQVDPFEYSHQGSLAYIGSERAVADISWFTGNIASGGTMTYLFWRSAYVSMCFSSKWRLYVCKRVCGLKANTSETSSTQQGVGDNGLDQGKDIWEGRIPRVVVCRTQDVNVKLSSLVGLNKSLASPQRQRPKNKPPRP